MVKRITKGSSITSRVRLKPITLIDLDQLRDIVAAAEEMPGHSRVYVEDLMKAPQETPGEHWGFRGLSIVHTVLEEEK